MTEFQPGAVKTPWHLWVVGIVSLLWNAGGASDYTMTQMQYEPYMSQFTPEQLEYFYGFPAWMDSVWALGVWGAMAGSLLLLFRSRFAVHAFSIALFGLIVASVYNYGLSNGLKVSGTGGAVFAVVIFIVSVILLVYARTMANRGVLR